MIIAKKSHQTLTTPRSLDISLLQQKLGLHLFSEEMERIIQKIK